MDMKLISELIDKVNASGLKSFEIEEKGMRMKLVNAKLVSVEPPVSPPAPAAVHPAIAPTPQELAAEEALGEDGADIVTITAPLVGIFYPLEDCGKEALSPGDPITPGQVVCAIEAMKLINEVESDLSGEYVKTLVKAGDQVEYGQPLMKVRKG